LLKRGGETVFFGDLGKGCRNLINYFESVPGVSPLPVGYNPATWMLECIGAGVGNTSADDTDFVQVFNNSEHKQMLVEAMARPGVATPVAHTAQLKFTQKRAASSTTQMRFVVGRFMDLYWRTPSYSLTRYVMLLILSLLFGLIFTGADYASYQGMNSGIGMIFIVMVFNGFVAFTSVIPIASQERASFYRERASQTYNAFWYFVGSTCAEIPYVFSSALLFTLIFYPLVGFTGFGTAVIFWVNFSLMLLMQTYMGQLFAYALPSEEVAAIMGILVLNILILFMGFSPPASTIPAGYKWLYTITPLRFPLGIAAALVFADCSTDPVYNELTATWSNVGPELGCQPLANSPVSLGHVTVKTFTEEVFKMKHDDIATNFVVVIAYIVGFRLLAALALRYINHQKR
ncbi:Atp-binding protein, partial [Globisporangium polare]